MDLNREKLAEALENAIRTVVPVEGVVKMSGGVAQMVVETIREPAWAKMDKTEKAMACCLHMLRDDGESHCQECPYNDQLMNAVDANKLYCIRDMIEDIYRLMTERRRAGQCPAPTETATVSKIPRVIPLDELLGTYGHGYLEMKYPPDELGEDPVEAIEECVWLNGEVLSKPEIGGYNHFPRKSIADGYGSVKGGMRIWDWIPTDEERKAVTWEATP